MEFAYVIYSPLLKAYKCLGGKFVINFEIYCASVHSGGILCSRKTAKIMECQDNLRRNSVVLSHWQTPLNLLLIIVVSVIVVVLLLNIDFHFLFGL